jgi:hypothetical protein
VARGGTDLDLADNQPYILSFPRRIVRVSDKAAVVASALAEWDVYVDSCRFTVMRKDWRSSIQWLVFSE